MCPVPRWQQQQNSVAQIGLHKSILIWLLRCYQGDKGQPAKTFRQKLPSTLVMLDMAHDLLPNKVLPAMVVDSPSVTLRQCCQRGLALQLVQGHAVAVVLMHDVA